MATNSSTGNIPICVCVCVNQAKQKEKKLFIYWFFLEWDEFVDFREMHSFIRSKNKRDIHNYF